jgi:hypothetical protein
MGLRTRYDRLLARHLRRPKDPLGRFVAGRLDRRNRGLIDSAIEALDLEPGSVVADIGFGLGLELLLAHGFRLRSIAELEGAIAGSGLTLVDHRWVGGGSVPAHLLSVDSL